MINERLNRWVGGLALLVVVSATTAVLMVGDRPLVSAVHFTILFDRVGRLRPGAPVKMNNLDLGRVESITYEKSPGSRSGGRDAARESDKGASSRSGAFGGGGADEQMRHHGRVRVLVWVRKAHQDFIRKNSRFLITAASLIGARHVEVLPPKGPPGPVVHAGDEVVGEPPPHIDRMLRMAYANLKRSTDLLNEIRPDIEEFSKESRRTRAILADLEEDKAHVVGAWEHGRSAYDGWVRNWHILSRATGKGRRIQDLAEGLKDASRHISARARVLQRRVEKLRAKFRRVEGNWKRVRSHPVQRLVPRLLRNIRLAIRRIEGTVKVVVRAVKHARGTVGALMQDHEIWDDFKESQRVIKQRIWTILGKGKQSSPAGYPMP